MSKSMMASVSAADVLRGRFREQVAKYRALVARSVDAGGVLSEVETSELVDLCDALKLPAERFEQDCVDLAGMRSAESRLQAVYERNAATVADVPKLEAELAALSAEFQQVRMTADAKCRALEAEMAEKRREMRKETTRYRESPDRLQREVMERREVNPVLFQAAVEPAEWPKLLEPRKRIIRG